MTPPCTFEEMARALAMEGAAWSCAREAQLLEESALAGGGEPAGAAAGARGLRVAARILEGLAPAAAGRPPFRPTGLKGALLAGHVALAAGRNEQAALIGRAIAAAAPDTPAGLRLVGEALFAQGRFHHAEVALREALDADPSDGVSRALHAEALWFSGSTDDAEAELARVIAAGGEGARLAEAVWYAARTGALGPIDPAGAGGRP